MPVSPAVLERADQRMRLLRLEWFRLHNSEVLQHRQIADELTAALRTRRAEEKRERDDEAC